MTLLILLLIAIDVNFYDVFVNNLRCMTKMQLGVRLNCGVQVQSEFALLIPLRFTRINVNERKIQN